MNSMLVAIGCRWITVPTDISTITPTRIGMLSSTWRARIASLLLDTTDAATAPLWVWVLSVVLLTACWWGASIVFVMSTCYWWERFETRGWRAILWRLLLISRCLCLFIYVVLVVHREEHASILLLLLLVCSTSADVTDAWQVRWSLFEATMLSISGRLLIGIASTHHYIVSSESEVAAGLGATLAAIGKPARIYGGQARWAVRLGWCGAVLVAGWPVTHAKIPCSHIWWSNCGCLLHF